MVRCTKSGPPQGNDCKQNKLFNPFDTLGFQRYHDGGDICYLVLIRKSKVMVYYSGEHLY